MSSRAKIVSLMPLLALALCASGPEVSDFVGVRALPKPREPKHSICSQCGVALRLGFTTHVGCCYPQKRCNRHPECIRVENHVDVCRRQNGEILGKRDRPPSKEQRRRMKQAARKAEKQARKDL